MTDRLDHLLSPGLEGSVDVAREAASDASLSGEGQANDPVMAKKLRYSQRLIALDRIDAPTDFGDALLARIARTAVGELAGLPKYGSIELFVGPSDAGKRHIARKIARLPDLQPAHIGDTITRPVVVLDTSPTDDVATLFSKLEIELDPGAGFLQAGNRGEDVQARARHLVQTRKLRWLVIPDADNLFSDKSETRSRQIAQTLAAMVDDPALALRLVLCGPHDMANFVRRTNLRVHASVHEFKRLSSSQLKVFLASYGAALPGVDTRILEDVKFLKDFAHATDCLPGAIVRLMRKAIEELRPNEPELLLGHFYDAHLPFDQGERRLFRP